MSKQFINISIANDFSPYTGARYRADGEKSGQEFYEDILKIKFQESLDTLNSAVFIDFDSTMGYASSFISEVFRRLVIDFKDKNVIESHLEFKSDDEPLLLDSVRKAIDETDPSDAI